MASANKDRPNLKICIDNVDANSDVEVSENDEDEVIIDTNIDEDSSLEGNVESEEEDRCKLAAVAKVTARACARRERPLSSSSPFRESGKISRKQKRDDKTDDSEIRFAAKAKDPPEPVKEKEQKQLYEDLGITDADVKAERSARGVRLDTVHVRGVDDMNTTDIKAYFKDFNPESVEWIDDSSCNVYWSDKPSAARAIIGMSVIPTKKARMKKEKIKTPGGKKSATEKNTGKADTKPKEQKRSTVSDESDDDELDLMSTDDEAEPKKPKETEKEEKDSPMEDEEEEGEWKDEEKMDVQSESSSSDESEESLDTESSLPPGKWRRGKPAQKGQNIFLRFATKADKKIVKAEKRSITGLLGESRKRNLRGAYMDREGVVADPGADEDEDLIAVGLVPRSSRHSQMSASQIPEETVFDLHTRAAQIDRLKQRRVKDRLQRWPNDDDVEQSSSGGDEIVDIDELIAPSKPKPTMRMYADDVEEEIRTKRRRIESAGLLAKNMEAAPQRDIRSRLQLNRRQQPDDERWDSRFESRYDSEPEVEDFERDWDAPETGRAAPPRREPILWRDRDELLLPVDPRAIEEQQKLFNKNPDWDQDRYKDLDAPEEDDDLFGSAAPVEEFGVEVVDLKKRIKAVADKENRLKMKEEEKEKEGEDEGKAGGNRSEAEEEEEDDEDDDRGKYSRKDWRLKPESKNTGIDLRSKLKKSRRAEAW